MVHGSILDVREHRTGPLLPTILPISLVWLCLGATEIWPETRVEFKTHRSEQRQSTMKAFLEVEGYQRSALSGKMSCDR